MSTERIVAARALVDAAMAACQKQPTAAAIRELRSARLELESALLSAPSSTADLHTRFHHLLIGGKQCRQCDYVAPLSETQLLTAAIDRLTDAVHELRRAHTERVR